MEYRTQFPPVLRLQVRAEEAESGREVERVVQCASYTVPAGCTLGLGHHRLHITRSRAGQENHFLMSRPSSPNGLIVY
ncbi:unnamed protein product [Arctogadus glacialis]